MISKEVQGEEHKNVCFECRTKSVNSSYNKTKKNILE